MRKGKYHADTRRQSVDIWHLFIEPFFGRQSDKRWFGRDQLSRVSKGDLRQIRGLHSFRGEHGVFSQGQWRKGSRSRGRLFVSAAPTSRPDARAVREHASSERSCERQQVRQDTG